MSTKQKIVGLIMVVVLGVVGFLYGPATAKKLEDAVAPVVSDVVAPVASDSAAPVATDAVTTENN